MMPIRSQQTIEPDEIISQDSVKTDTGTVYTTQARFGDQIFTCVEQQPEFPGGINAMMEYLANHIKYPKEAINKNIEGKVFIKFVVSETGQVENAIIMRGIGGGCEEEALRVVEEMPVWQPGRQDGEAVAVYYTLPVVFNLTGGKKEKKNKDD